LLENLLHVGNFAPHLPARFFGRPSITQVWISRRLPGLFFRFAFRFLEAPLNFIPCARFHENKIASYELGGCNLIETEGDRQTKKQNGGSHLPPLYPRCKLSAAALLTAAVFAAGSLLATAALLTAALFAAASLLATATLLTGGGRFDRFVWILLCVHDAFLIIELNVRVLRTQ
jgi:hypothetical protein